MPKNINYLITKLDRFAAWTMLCVVMLFAISGYGMTKGLINTELARSLHLNILFPIGLVAFCAHTGWAVHLSLKRWRVWNKTTAILLILAYSLILVGGLYIEFVHDWITRDSVNVENTLPIFTAETLAQYNGQNGQPAYTAVDGKVYDMSTVFINGRHKGHDAGQELSAEFFGEHAAEILSGYQVVGTYKK
ncbi:MAG: hypothetical protein ABH846_03250 [Patescibacteria group bacterium]